MCQATGWLQVSQLQVSLSAAESEALPGMDLRLASEGRKWAVNASAVLALGIDQGSIQSHTYYWNLKLGGCR